jgi:hypothetical protein
MAPQNHADNTGRKHLLCHVTHMGSSSKHLELENVENIQIVYAGAFWFSGNELGIICSYRPRGRLQRQREADYQVSMMGTLRDHSGLFIYKKPDWMGTRRNYCRLVIYKETRFCDSQIVICRSPAINSMRKLIQWESSSSPPSLCDIFIWIAHAWNCLLAIICRDLLRKTGRQ